MTYSGDHFTGAGTGASAGISTGGFDAVLAAGDGSAPVVIGDLHTLLHGDYARLGQDLLITSPDGARTLVTDFFSGARPVADLAGPDGALLKGTLVAKLAGPGPHGVQVAQAGPDAPTAQPIGTVTKAAGEVFATRADGSRVALQSGDQVFQGDVLETGPEGAVGIVFIDETEFSLGGDGRMVLDEMIYDPDGGAGSSSFSLVSGTFSFVSGEIAKLGADAMQVDTPVATIGIRGTKGLIRVSSDDTDNDGAPDFRLEVALLDNGEIVVTTFQGKTQVINQVFTGFRVDLASGLRDFGLSTDDPDGNGDGDGSNPGETTESFQVDATFVQSDPNILQTVRFLPSSAPDAQDKDLLEVPDGLGPLNQDSDFGDRQTNTIGPLDEGDGTELRYTETRTGEVSRDALELPRGLTLPQEVYDALRNLGAAAGFQVTTTQIIDDSRETGGANDQNTQGQNQQGQTQDDEDDNDTDQQQQQQPGSDQDDDDQQPPGDTPPNDQPPKQDPPTGGDDGGDGGSDGGDGGSDGDGGDGGSDGGDGGSDGGDGDGSDGGSDGGDGDGDGGSDGGDGGSDGGSGGGGGGGGGGGTGGGGSSGGGTGGGTGGGGAGGGGGGGGGGGTTVNHTMTPGTPLDVSGSSDAYHVTGSAANDSVTTGSGNDSILGGAGDDVILTNAGDDTVAGEDGADSVTGGSGLGNDLYYGGDASTDSSTGDKLIYTSAINGVVVDLLNGYATGPDIGTDTISGFEELETGSGDDVITAAPDTTVITTGDGADFVLYESGSLPTGATVINKSANGSLTLQLNDGATAIKTVTEDGDGDPLITYASGTVSVKSATSQNLLTVFDGTFDLAVAAANAGTAGDDTLSGTASGDALFGNGGTSDSIEGMDGADLLFGGTGADHLLGGDGNDTLVGDGGADQMDGGMGADLLLGGDGNDTLDGGEGHDSIYGEYGDDDLLAGMGNDTYFGGAGSDILVSGGTSFSIAGSDGDDLLSGDDGADVYRLQKFAGNDTIEDSTNDNALMLYDGSNHEIVDISLTGSGMVWTFASTNTLTFTTVDVLADVENVSNGTTHSVGFAGDQTINEDLLLGTATADSLTGDDGHDILAGADGADELNGGAGNDTLLGGSGNDVYDVGIDSLTGGDADVIRDSAGIDTLVLDGYLTELVRTGDDLYVTVADTSAAPAQTITIKDHFTTGGIEMIRLNGTDHSVLESTGTGGNDLVLAADGGDTLTDGGAGDDVLVGSTATDTYQFTAGLSGNDTIIDSGGADSDVIDLGTSGLPTNAYWVQDGDDPSLHHLVLEDSAGNTLTIQQQWDGTNAAVATIQSAGKSYTITEPPGPASSGGAFVAGMNGQDDTLNGHIGTDALFGGSGNDNLYGNDGNDYLNGGAGDDLIYGGDGDDTIAYSDYTDSIYGGTGFDLIELTGSVMTTDSGTFDDVLEVEGLLLGEHSAVSLDLSADVLFDFDSTLYVHGDSADSLSSDVPWSHVGTYTDTVSGVTYDEFSYNDGYTLTLYVQDGIVSTGLTIGGATANWTGSAGDNLWGSGTNWTAAPNAGDDVVVNTGFAEDVVYTAMDGTVAVDSLTLRDGSSLSVVGGTLSVLALDGYDTGDRESLTATLTVAGGTVLSGGVEVGQLNVSSGSLLQGGSGDGVATVSGFAFGGGTIGMSVEAYGDGVIGGTVALDGFVTMNSSQLDIGGATLTMTNSIDAYWGTVNITGSTVFGGSSSSLGLDQSSLTVTDSSASLGSIYHTSTSDGQAAITIAAAGSDSTLELDSLDIHTMTLTAVTGRESSLTLTGSGSSSIYSMSTAGDAAAARTVDVSGALTITQAFFDQDVTFNVTASDFLVADDFGEPLSDVQGLLGPALWQVDAAVTVAGGGTLELSDDIDFGSSTGTIDLSAGTLAVNHLAPMVPFDLTQTKFDVLTGVDHITIAGTSMVADHAAFLAANDSATPSAVTITIDGESGDTLTLNDDSDWTFQNNFDGYAIYEHNTSEMRLAVHEDVSTGLQTGF